MGSPKNVPPSPTTSGMGALSAASSPTGLGWQRPGTVPPPPAHVPPPPPPPFPSQPGFVAPDGYRSDDFMRQMSGSPLDPLGFGNVLGALGQGQPGGFNPFDPLGLGAPTPVNPLGGGGPLAGPLSPSKKNSPPGGR